MVNRNRSLSQAVLVWRAHYVRQLDEGWVPVDRRPLAVRPPL